MKNRLRIVVVAGIAVHLQLAVAQETPPLPSQRMTPAEIQSEPALAPTGLPGEDLRLEPETPSQEPVIPPWRLRFQRPPPMRPILPALTRGVGAVNALSGVSNLSVKRFEFRGNHVYSRGTLEKVIESYSHRKITAEELEQAREALTQFYVSHGYINSGAVLDEQDPRGGVITFRIVEGRLTEIYLSGNHWFMGYWLRHEFRKAAGTPLNFEHLKEGLELLRQNPLIAQVNGELKPGGAPGESILEAQVKDTQPFRVGVDLNNSRPPSVGSEILNLHFADLNLTGNNDPLHLDYGILQSTRNQGIRASGWDNEDGSYSLPVGPWDTALQIHGSKSDTAIVEAPFNTLNITSRLEEYGYAIRQPLYETLTDDFAVSVALDSDRDKTFLLGMPFTLSPGAVNGVSDVTVLRFAQEYVNRSTVHVFAARSTFNLGIAALNATVNNSGEDSRFVSWLGQTQYIRRLHDTDNLLVVRVYGQVSNSALLAPEQFNIGGIDSVRGYRENELLRDNGMFGSIEVRIPVFRDRKKSPVLTVAPFFDVGAGWNTLSEKLGVNPGGQGSGSGGEQTAVLPAAGVGLIFTPSAHFHANLYWGYGFNREYVAATKNDPQDYGVYFTVSVDAF